MIPMLLFSLAAGGPAGVAPPEETPTTDPPISLTRSFYSGGRIQFDVVVSGQGGAYTRLYEGTTLRVTLDPGVTHWESALFSLGTMFATHYRHGIESSRVQEGGA